MHKKRRIPHALADEGPGAPTPADRTRIEATLASSTLPLFDFGGLVVRAEVTGPALLYHFYGRQFPIDDRRVAVIEDLHKDGAFGELGRFWVSGANGWREWPPTRLGADEHDLLVRVTDSIRLQVLHTLDFRKALANPASPDDRKRGRELSRIIARDAPVARDLAGNLLDTVDRLSVGHDATPGAVASGVETPPSAGPLPVRGAPSPPLSP